MIYFIRCGEYVKIGYTRHSLARRVQDLQIGNPFDLVALGLIDGDIPFERSIHERFSHSHFRGEWFHFTDEIKTFMEDRLASTPEEIDNENRSMWALQAFQRMSV